MTRVQLHRHVAADPASVALLLAGPTDRDPQASGDTAALRLVAQRTADVAGVIVATPRRRGVGFVASIDVSDGNGTTVHGTVTVVPATDPGCELALDLELVDEESAGRLRREAGAFLESLARRARSRAFAA